MRRRRPARWPGALTDREVEVVRLLAAGRSKREIATRLVRLALDGAHAHRPHLREGRRLHARGARHVGDGARPGDPGRAESTERSMRRPRPPPYGGRRQPTRCKGDHRDRDHKRRRGHRAARLRRLRHARHGHAGRRLPSRRRLDPPNDDRFQGAKTGWPDVAAFFGESGELTQGTLRVEPHTTMAAGDLVTVLARVTATRPDGRRLRRRAGAPVPARGRPHRPGRPVRRRSGRRGGVLGVIAPVSGACRVRVMWRGPPTR